MNEYMKTQTILENRSVLSVSAHDTTGIVTSQDGASIGYRQIGHGPGVVMLHGAMESARSHTRLAEALADAYTVYLPERRGHNLSGPFYKDYSMRKEVEDLDALLTKTGAHNVFGVSAGGLICLQAALSLPTIHKVAIYEPALIVNGSASTAFLKRYDQEIAQGKLSAALVTGMQAAQLGPPLFNTIPRWILELLTTLALKQEDKKARAGDVTMRALAPTLHYDFQLVEEMAETLENFKFVRAEVLLLGGSASPAWLKVALDGLEQALPHVKRVEFPGLNHGGSSDEGSTNRGGRPELVAHELRRFFLKADIH
jgi:pimeloyl-ACP methyl ester carboxylesterase